MYICVYMCLSPQMCTYFDESGEYLCRILKIIVSLSGSGSKKDHLFFVVIGLCLSELVFSICFLAQPLLVLFSEA